MRSLGYSMLLAAALVVAPACTKKSDDAKTEASALPAGGPIALIPDAAEFVVGLSPKAISGSPIFGVLGPELEQQSEYRELLATFKDCNLDPLKFDSVIVGMSQSQDWAAVVVGDGVGDDNNASCIVKSMQKQAGDAQVADVVTKDGKKMIEFTDGRMYLLDGRTLAMASPGWQDVVGGLIDGKGTPANSGGKKDLFGKVDATASIWGMAAIPPEYASMAPALGAPPEFASIRSVAGSIDLSSGAAITTLAVFDSADTAKSVADELQATIGDARDMVPAELSNVVNSVKIEASGTDLKLALSATMDDINKAKAMQAPF